MFTCIRIVQSGWKKKAICVDTRQKLPHILFEEHHFHPLLVLLVVFTSHLRSFDVSSLAILKMGSIISSVKPPFFYKASLVTMVVGKRLWPTALPIFDSWIPGTCLGIPLFLVGARIAIDSKKKFKKTNTPMMGKATSSSPLHTSGYFSYTRNPMYLGISLALVGASLVSNCAYNLVLPVTSALIMNQYYIPVEEQQLEQAFGEKYRTYMQTVPRWI